jgi:hypothetical protein
MPAARASFATWDDERKRELGEAIVDRFEAARTSVVIGKYVRFFCGLIPRRIRDGEDGGSDRSDAKGAA